MSVTVGAPATGAGERRVTVGAPQATRGDLPAGHDSAVPAGHVEPQPAPDMDYPEHETTYSSFTHFVEVGTVTVINLVVVLVIAGIRGAFLSAGFGLVLALAAGALGWAKPSLSWRPGVIASAVLGLIILLTA